MHCSPLRPYPISKMRVVPDEIEKPDWALDGIPKIEPDSDLQKRVEIKTPEQIERMRETCRIAREVLDAGARIIKPGITTDEIDRVIHEETIARGHITFLYKFTFNSDLQLVIWSVNEVICHGIPDARKLEDGDIVNIDVTVYYKGVHGDLNETYFVGNVDEASKQLVRCSYECLEKAIAIGAWQDRLWPDEWTAVTVDGKRSAQFEHTLLVTETGCEVLTARLPSSPDVFPWLKP
ncbi:hypothetical protein PR202_gb07152 [Eleusine coracana subsp. coracana]|uniref:Peptidase M24 domain-containing protein n=1 Tax=Eleusine coracana subsp. coracana TaxID=191504 RepID=A0AAV5E9P1_ELECO|nr:hypothetical protein PR202_gb07152 [Eleusine coracana subsp. coracana]